MAMLNNQRVAQTNGTKSHRSDYELEALVPKIVQSPSWATSQKERQMLTS